MATIMNGVVTNGADAAQSENDTRILAHNMMMQFSVSMALKAVVELRIPDVLARAEGKRPLSVAEILAELPTKSTPGPKSERNLRRLFNPLVREGFFVASFSGDESPVYGLTEISKWFVRDGKCSMAPIADLQLSSVLLTGCWDRLHDLILDEADGLPFKMGKGVPFWEYCGKVDPKFGTTFQDAMIGYSKLFSNLVDDLQQCDELDGVKTLVDVGGGQGAIVGDIVSRNPHIQGINFDLPHVIDTAPQRNGVQHVAGTFFKEVPSGDAMFLRFIVHDHGDDDAIKILDNCFKALPKSGKIIIAEYVLNNKLDNKSVGSFKESIDLIMFTHLQDGQERTGKEYQNLLLAVGFQRPKVIWNDPGPYQLVVGYKG